MSWSFDPSSWTAGTKPTATDFQHIATDLHTRGAAVDGGAYGRANTGYITLVAGAVPGTTYTISAASWTTGVATITIGSHAILTGQLVTISSVTPSGYNQSFALVTAVTGTTISYADTSNPGVYSSGGSVLVGGVTAADGMLAVDQNGALTLRKSGSFSPVGGGTVTHTGSLTSGVLVVGNGSADVTALAALSWTAATPGNGWSNFGSGNIALAYVIDALGFVHIRGVITGGTTTANTTLFTLPSGYRPSALEIFPVTVTNGSSPACGIYIDTSGNVKILNGWSGITTVALVASFSTT